MQKQLLILAEYMGLTSGFINQTTAFSFVPEGKRRQRQVSLAYLERGIPKAVKSGNTKTLDLVTYFLSRSRIM